MRVCVFNNIEVAEADKVVQLPVIRVKAWKINRVTLIGDRMKFTALKQSNQITSPD